MKNDDQIRKETIDMINYLIEEYKNKIPDDAIAFVKEYCDVDEYEMAFEGFLIDFMKENIMLPLNIKKKYGK